MCLHLEISFVVYISYLMIFDMHEKNVFRLDCRQSFSLHQLEICNFFSCTSWISVLFQKKYSILLLHQWCQCRKPPNLFTLRSSQIKIRYHETFHFLNDILTYTLDFKKVSHYLHRDTTFVKT